MLNSERSCDNARSRALLRCFLQFFNHLASFSRSPGFHIFLREEQAHEEIEIMYNEAAEDIQLMQCHLGSRIDAKQKHKGQR